MEIYKPKVSVDLTCHVIKMPGFEYWRGTYSTESVSVIGSRWDKFFEIRAEEGIAGAEKFLNRYLICRHKNTRR